MSEAAVLPAAFVQFRELVEIHLRRILEIPRKEPIHAVALLVVVACEALSRMLGRAQEDIFVNEYLHRHEIPLQVGRDLFDVLRNGLAHVYRPYPIFVDRLEVQPTMTWKDGARAHLRVVSGTENPEGHLILGPFQEGAQPRLCLNVESMVNDLNDLFSELAAQLLTDAELRAAVNRNAREMRTTGSKHPAGDAAAAWRSFVNARKLLMEDD